MPTLFTKIIEGAIPCHKLYEDDEFLSFLDIRPISPGHALIIPKKEIDYIFDVDDALLSKIMVRAKPIAKAIEQVVTCERVGVIVAGLEVPHAHVHLVPIRAISDINFAHAKDADQEELAQLAEGIRNVLAGR